MKKFRNLLILSGLLIAAISCSDKDEPTPLKDVEFGLFEESIEVPQSMQTSDNQYAQNVNHLISSINPAFYSSFFTVPEGATRVNGTITASNARTSANVVTYEWSSQDMSIAYQITEQTDSYFYEIFIKYDSNADYKKWYEGGQAKDRKSGYFVILDPYATDRSVEIRYDYEIKSDNSFYIEYSSSTDNLQVLIRADKSGYIKRLENNKVVEEYIWDGTGKGSWTRYNSDGTVDKVTWS